MSKHKKIISWILLIIWMGIIFFMSHQPGEISSNQSDLVLKIFSFIGIELNEYFGTLATFLIRKTAHFSEYIILFLLAYNVTRYYIKTKRIKLLVIIFVFIYACTDEFHQFFIPGRKMSFIDVLIDTSGGLFGSIITTIIERFKYRNRKTSL